MSARLPYQLRKGIVARTLDTGSRSSIRSSDARTYIQSRLVTERRIRPCSTVH